MRTYLPGLIRLVRAICMYTTRNDARLRQVIPDSAIPAYEAMIAACSVFLAVIPERPVAN